MSIDFDTSELADLATHFQQAGVVTQRLTSRRLTKAGQTLLREAQRNAPVDSGDLQNSLTLASGPNWREVYSELRYAKFVEFGTSDAPPQPFMEPAERIATRGFAEDIVNAGMKALEG